MDGYKDKLTAYLKAPRQTEVAALFFCIYGLTNSGSFDIIKEITKTGNINGRAIAYAETRKTREKYIPKGAGGRR